MDAFFNNAGLLPSNVNSVPPAQNDPAMQEDQQNDKTAEEKELAAAQLRLNELPMSKILSIMRKALPEDAHIDADVDMMMRTCIAKFSDVLTKEAKRQENLARHKVMQCEDIIKALKDLGFEGSSNALSLFYSRYMESMNSSSPQEVQSPVQTSVPISTEILEQDSSNVPTGNPFGPNIGSTDIGSPVHTSDPIPTEIMELQPNVNVPTENTSGSNEGCTHVESSVNTSEQLPTEMAKRQKLEDNLHAQLPENVIGPLPTEMRRRFFRFTSLHSREPDNDYVHKLRNLLHSTMPQPPSPALLSQPLSSMQPAHMQQTELERNLLDAMVSPMLPNPDNTQPAFVPITNQLSSLQGPVNLNPPSSFAPFSQPMAHSDAGFAQQVRMQMNNLQQIIERYIPNIYGFGDQQMREPTVFNAPAPTPMDQPAFPGYTQMASQQQIVGGCGTTMATNCIPESRTSSALFNDIMCDADLADTFEVLREHGVFSDEPGDGEGAAVSST